MAKFNELNLVLKDNQKIKLGDGQNSNIFFDGDNLTISGANVLFSGEISGFAPSGNGHLSTKKYIDDKFESGCHVYRNSTQTIPHTGFHVVQFNTIIYDYLDEYDSTNYRFKPKRSGIYLVTSGVHLLSLEDAQRSTIGVFKNSGSEYARGTDFSNGDATSATPFLSVPVKMYAGDYLDIQIYQYNNSTDTKDTYADPSGAYVCMIVQRIA